MQDVKTKNQLEEIRLMANENLFGPSPKVLEAIRTAKANYQIYPEYYPISLKEKISDTHGVPTGQIAIGAGSVELIDMLIRTCCNMTQNILITDYSFVAYGQLANMHHRNLLVAPLNDFSCNPENIINTMDEQTSLIFIANPNNPTGTMMTHYELVSLLEKIPSDVTVVIDEAYAEYVCSNDYPDTISLLPHYPNLVILHSFSKIYGLAGLRVGYAFASEEIVQTIEQNKVPFTVNAMGIRAACSAIKDQDYVKQCAEINVQERSFLFSKLSNLGYQTYQSFGNFLFVYMEDEMLKNKLHLWLQQQNLHVCNLSQFGQSNSLRISTYNHEASIRIVESMKSFKS